MSPRLSSNRLVPVCTRLVWTLLGVWLPAALAQAADLRVELTDETGAPLPHAVVSLHGAPEPPAPSGREAVMDQRNRQFSPHVLAVRAGTLVRFPNSDDIRHHVYSFSPAKRFELRLYHGTTADPVRFDRPGKVALGCNIHDAMLGYIYVLDTPWFGVSEASGEVHLAGVPAGEYRLQVQHPRLEAPLGKPLALSADKASVRRITLGPLQPDPRQREPESDLQRLFE